MCGQIVLAATVVCLEEQRVDEAKRTTGMSILQVKGRRRSVGP